MKKHWLLFLAALAAGSTAAQTGAPPDPTAPAAPVPRLEYRSVFTDYKPAGEDRALPWRAANEAVQAADDHAGHGGHGERPAAPPSQRDGESHRDHGAHQ